MVNAWRRLCALNPETEIWWDSSPLVWHHFRENFMKSGGLSEADKKWFREETESMFFDAPTKDWIFSGCTTNPPLSWNVIKAFPDEWNAVIKEKRKAYKGRSKYGLFRMVYFEVVKRGAEKFLPLFEASDGRLGHISGQVDPGLIRNTPGMCEMAEELASLSPNVMIKVPGSSQGMPVYRYLASKGIATNGTLVYTVPQIMTVAKMVDEGRKIHLAENKKPRRGWRAVCTHMSGRFDDTQALRGYINDKNYDISPLELRHASEAVVKKCARLIAERRHPIKVLDCSHRFHYNEKDELFFPHIEMFAGGPIVYTIPPPVMGIFMTTYRNREIVPAWDRPVPEEKLKKLLHVPYFRNSYEEDGLGVDQFSELPSLLETEKEFASATQEMIEYVGQFL